MFTIFAYILINKNTEMTEQKTSMTQNAINYSLVTGVIIIIFSLLLFILDVDMYANRSLGYVNYIILIVGIFLGSKAYRNNTLGGYATYGEVYGAGFLIVVFTAIVVTIYTYLYFTVINTDAISDILRVTEQAMYDKGLDGEQLDTALAVSKKFVNPIVLCLSTLFGFIIWGAIITVVISFFVKKEQN